MPSLSGVLHPVYKVDRVLVQDAPFRALPGGLLGPVTAHVDLQLFVLLAGK